MIDTMQYISYYIRAIFCGILNIQSASYSHPTHFFVILFYINQTRYFLKAAVAVSNTLQINSLKSGDRTEQRQLVNIKKHISGKLSAWYIRVCFAVITNFQGQRVCTKRYNLLSNVMKSVQYNYNLHQQFKIVFK